MREIADELGLTRQAIYLHFPNRAALLLAAVRHFDAQHEDRKAGRQWLELEPVHGLQTALRYWLGYLPTVLAVATALEGAALVGDDGADAWHDRMQHLHEAQRPFVARLAANGLLAEGWSIDRATDWVWARTQPSVWRHLVVERGWPPNHVVDRLVESITSEIVAPRERNSR
jgi:AcrR family transcriptional regulator